MKQTEMTNSQLRALLEAIRIINDKSKDKQDFDSQLVRIQNSIEDEEGSVPATDR